jgi:hypothetical protein
LPFLWPIIAERFTVVLNQNNTPIIINILYFIVLYQSMMRGTVWISY